MGFGISDHGISNTGLGLGLGLFCHEKEENCSDHQRNDHHNHHLQQKKQLKYDHIFPSLTLGLHPQDQAYAPSANKIEEITDHLQQPRSSSSPSAVSSFSNSSVKKEREYFCGAAGEELETEKVSSRTSDEDEGSPRKKLRLTKQQSAVLEDNFKEHSTLNPKQKQALAEQLNLRPRQVEVWFQNRRARTKLKQTEVDCEMLKKCCESLTEENKRLQKELQELKSLKLQAAPLYMQLPAATLTMCPSCERIGNSTSGDGSTSAASTITVGPKPHNIYTSPFTHPSAAC